MPDKERYGLNIVAAQLEDPMIQEAFRDQERVNAELRSKIMSLTSEVATLKAIMRDQAEGQTILMDE
tara:strand:- start:1096 stop:1296 length:201 start_codon:yes stop_codon:yes gene_type:complete